MSQVPEKRLWQSVLLTATNDARGRFSLELPVAEQKEKMMARIKNHFDRARKTDIDHGRFRLWTGVSLETHNARSWFRGQSPDFKNVCDYAGLHHDDVTSRMLPKIAEIEVAEQEIAAYQKVMYGTR